MRELPFIAVGGGLAGSAFALELARNGAPVMVQESSGAPHHKVCGEFLSAEAQSLIAYSSRPELPRFEHSLYSTAPLGGMRFDRAIS
jgi:flavin-dependent dehydrogenase